MGGGGSKQLKILNYFFGGGGGGSGQPGNPSGYTLADWFRSSRMDILML